METREEPRFVQFGAGEIVAGTLIGIQPIIVRDKRAIRYTVQEDDGSFVAFIGTYQLNTKLRTDDRLKRIEIRCIGEDTMVKRGENCMKVFEVKVSKDRVKTNAENPDLGITDDDIPW